MIADLKVHFSLRDVLRSAQEAVQVSDSPIGQLAATRGAEKLSESLQRKINGNYHPYGAHPIRDG